MGTKSNPGKYDCYAKAAPDEPLFTLLARDKHAPEVIKFWASLKIKDGENPNKISEALDCAEHMRDWRATNNKQLPRCNECGVVGGTHRHDCMKLISNQVGNGQQGVE